MLNILSLILFLCLIISLIFIIRHKTSFNLKILILLFTSTLFFGSLLLYFVLYFGEDDIAWYSLFFFPIFYLYSLYFLIKLILKLKNIKNKRQ